MMCFRRFKGMIRPGMGMDYSQSKRIADRKSVPLVMYLRARRELTDATSPQWMRDAARWDKDAMRKAHLRIRRRGQG